MESCRLYFDPPCRSGGDNMLFLGNGDSIFRGTRSAMNMEEASKRRPFFSSPDELFDEEYYDEQVPDKKRRLTPDQVHMLEKSFEAENKLEPERKTQLANKLGLQPRQVAVWFQNRRARRKTKQLERDYDQLKASYDILLSDYDSILKENGKLKAEVQSLTEQVQVEEVVGEPIQGEKVADPIPVDAARVQPFEINVKVEDRLSTGSGASVVVDEEGPQLVDSGDSYFPNDDYPGCVAPLDGSVQSEEDDGSDGGRSYFSDVLVAADQQPHQVGELLGWWFWP